MERMDRTKVFEFLTPDEVDELIKAKLASHSSKGGRWANKAGKLWDERTINIRRAVVYDLLGQGLSRVRIAQELMARWGVTEKPAYDYIKDALENLISDNENFKDSVRESMMHRLESLAEDALAHNDRKSALSAYEQMNKLQGLYVNKVEADVKEDTTIRFEFGN